MDGQVDVFETVQDIPAEYDAIFEPLGAQSVFFSRAWFAVLTKHGLEPGLRPHFLGVRDDAGLPVVLFPAAVTGPPDRAAADAVSGEVVAMRATPGWTVAPSRHPARASSSNRES